MAKEKYNEAGQTFWAMHVEAVDWCGFTTRKYAAAHGLSWRSLKTWRRGLTTGEVEFDWRVHLQPSACQATSSVVGSASEERQFEDKLDRRATGMAPERDGCSPPAAFSDEARDRDGGWAARRQPRSANKPPNGKAFCWRREH